MSTNADNFRALFDKMKLFVPFYSSLLLKKSNIFWEFNHSILKGLVKCAHMLNDMHNQNHHFFVICTLLFAVKCIPNVYQIYPVDKPQTLLRSLVFSRLLRQQRDFYAFQPIVSNNLQQLENQYGAASYLYAARFRYAI
ncbi:hypothetical protein [Paenibacillus sp. PL91]|uniref:hypothetical protein n=1 Tax=Paenibacillus sp. PL91 TaxID=2729538 RepID=UPI00145D73F3|nr:hypothetical protein [Paenibacillus sp. PL91]MBC9204315.1 hypothetical protein [Paenibacillus sp. PL91]